MASVFDVEASSLSATKATQNPDSPFDAVKNCLLNFSDFSSKSTRFEYWWFFVFILVVAGIATFIHNKAYQIVGILCLIPFLAAGSRRLNDARGQID